MQLRYAVLAIAAVLTCSNFRPAVACPVEAVSSPPAQLTSETHFLADIEEDETVPSQIREQAAALAHTAPELMVFSTDLEDGSVSAIDVRADREIGPVAPAFWSYDDEFPGAEEQATGTTPLTESITRDGYEDR